MVHGPFSSPSSFQPWSDCVNVGKSTWGADHGPRTDVAVAKTERFRVSSPTGALYHETK